MRLAPTVSQDNGCNEAPNFNFAKMHKPDQFVALVQSVLENSFDGKFPFSRLALHDFRRGFCDQIQNDFSDVSRGLREPDFNELLFRRYEIPLRV